VKELGEVEQSTSVVGFEMKLIGWREEGVFSEKQTSVTEYSLNRGDVP